MLSPNYKNILISTYFIFCYSDIGETTMNINTPHTLTTWDANVFCVSDEVGFGMSYPSSLVTFLPFFLMVYNPKTFIRTETLPVTVTVYNYLGHSLPVSRTVFYCHYLFFYYYFLFCSLLKVVFYL